jgi:hypothetical protein
LKESPQPIESRFRVHGVRSRGSPPRCDPVAVSAYLINFLNWTVKFLATALEDIEQSGKASMLYVLNGIVHDPHQNGVAEPYFLILDLRKNLISDCGLEDREKHQDGEIIKVVQAKRRSLDDGVRLEVFELVIAAELTISGKGFPVLAAKPRKGLRMSSGCLIPLPGIVESHHSSRLWRAASNVN